MDSYIQYWLDISKYDLITAHAMLGAERYLYVGFMCHQAIEKILKAYIKLIRNEMPRTHNLAYLAQETGIYPELDEEKLDTLDELEPLNIEPRYPSHREALLKTIDMAYATRVYEKTRELYEWINSKLLKNLKNI